MQAVEPRRVHPPSRAIHLSQQGCPPGVAEGQRQSQPARPRQQALVQAQDHPGSIPSAVLRSPLADWRVPPSPRRHKKALKIAVEITGEIKQLFKRGFDECSRHIAKKESYQEKKGKKADSAKAITGDKIEFSYSVLLNARDILQELVKMQTYSEIVEGSYAQIQGEMIDVKSKIYYWKSNPENNIKMLRQSFSTRGDT
jgi:hypothetical protein